MNARLLVVPALAIAVALVFWKASPDRATGVPACTWRVGTGDGARQARMADELAPETAIRLSCWCDEPRYYYVFSHSAEDGTLLLWPSPLLQSDLPQPLPAGANVLPGRSQGNDLSWTSRTGIRATTTFVVVAARERIAELDELTTRVRQWSNTVFPDHSMQVTKPKPTGAAELAGAPGTATFPSPLLQRAAARNPVETMANGPLQPDGTLDGVWTGLWTCVEKKPDAK